jgi:hypothetical protein
MFLKIEGSVGDLRGFLEKVKLSRGAMGFLEEMRKRFLRALEGARRMPTRRALWSFRI